MRQVFYGAVWTVTIYFVAYMIVNALSAGAESQDPDLAALKLYVLLGAGFVGISGAFMGVLPGTKHPQIRHGGF
jgi:hypothetical protein